MEVTGVWSSSAFVCLFARYLKNRYHRNVPLRVLETHILGSKGQRTWLQGTKNSAGMGFCTLVSADFF